MLLFVILIAAPRVIVYDNACNLHTYCLNRDPVFFKHSRFLIDRLHWRDHTGECVIALNVLLLYLFQLLNVTAS